MQEETCLKFSQAEGTLWLSQTRAVGGEGCRARCSSIFLGAAAFLPRHYGADVLRGGPSSPPLSKPGLSSDLSQIFCGRRHGSLICLGFFTNGHPPTLYPQPVVLSDPIRITSPQLQGCSPLPQASQEVWPEQAFISIYCRDKSLMPRWVLGCLELTEEVVCMLMPLIACIF